MPSKCRAVHLAARLCLAHQSSDEATRTSDETTPLDDAVQWLEQCVMNFYSVPPESEVDLELTLILYR